MEKEPLADLQTKGIKTNKMVDKIKELLVKIPFYKDYQTRKKYSGKAPKDISLDSLGGGAGQTPFD